MNQTNSFRSGYVSIIGRPNVGKSTLLNQLVAQKVAATSNRPQTTRNKITGVVHLTDAQIILVDTPGIHATKRTLNEMMVQASISTYTDVDLLLVLIDAVEGFLPEDEFVLKSMEHATVPKILVINSLKTIIKKRGDSTSVGDEGGFAPMINDNEDALKLIVKAIAKSGFKNGKDISICLDVAANDPVVLP